LGLDSYGGVAVTRRGDVSPALFRRCELNRPQEELIGLGVPGAHAFAPSPATRPADRAGEAVSLLCENGLRVARDPGKNPGLTRSGAAGRARPGRRPRGDRRPGDRSPAPRPPADATAPRRSVT